MLVRTDDMSTDNTEHRYVCERVCVSVYVFVCERVCLCVNVFVCERM